MPNFSRFNKQGFLLHHHPPVKDLPPEILADIFVKTLGELPIGIAQNFIHEKPWSFLRVCKLWRNVALAEHRLWNNVALYPSGLFSQDNMTVTEWHDFVIKRLGQNIFTRCSQFSIRVQGVDFSTRYVAQINHSLPALINTCLSRLHTLVLSIPVQTLPTLYQLPPDALSNVERLELKFPDATILPFELWENDDLERYTSIFSQARNLQEFSLHSDWPHTVLPQGVPWNQLVYVNIVLRDWQHSMGPLDLLQLCINCRTCCLHSTESDIEMPKFSNSTAITLPHLQRLSFQSINSAFVDHLNLPSLITLRLESHTRNQLPLDRICSLVTRSRCALQSFTYDAPPMRAFARRSIVKHPPLAIDRLFAIAPSLRALVLPYTLVPVPNLKLITTGESLPDLERLECGLEAEGLVHFVDLVACRFYSKERPLDPRRSLCSAAARYFGSVGEDHSQAYRHAQHRFVELRNKYGQGIILGQLSSFAMD